MILNSLKFAIRLKFKKEIRYIYIYSLILLGITFSTGHDKRSSHAPLDTAEIELGKTLDITLEMGYDILM